MRSKLINQIKDKISDHFHYVLIFISVLTAVSLARNVIRIRRVNKSIEEEGTRFEKLEAENEELKAKVEIYKSEDYKEKQVRDKLGLVKEGELVVVLPDDEVLRKIAPKRMEDQENLPDSNWKKWWKLFF